MNTENNQQELINALENGGSLNNMTFHVYAELTFSGKKPLVITNCTFVNIDDYGVSFTSLHEYPIICHGCTFISNEYWKKHGKLH